MGHRLRQLGAVALAAGGAMTAGLIAPPQTEGFGTINTPDAWPPLNQRAEHMHITRAALACSEGRLPPECFEPISLGELAGTGLAPAAGWGAVGAPDRLLAGDPRPQQHCDGGDFLATKYLPRGTEYPRDRRQAVATLLSCRRFLLGRLRDGAQQAREMLDRNGRLVEGRADLNPVCALRYDAGGEAKCEALEEFGRVLHGVQDFYSHSNWTDVGGTTIVNPPGLGRSAPASLLDFTAKALKRRDLGDWMRALPRDLATGCFDDHDRNEDEDEACPGRIRHRDLNKDKGTITDGGVATLPVTPRGGVGFNFARAVRLAVADTRRQWRAFGSELEDRYGEDRAELIRCALTHDDAFADCEPEDCGSSSRAESATFEPGVFRGTGHTLVRDPDQDEERQGATCDEFFISFVAGRSTITRLRITSLDWSCTAVKSGDKRDPLPVLELPYFSQPDGLEAQVLRHERGVFGFRRRFLATSPLGPIRVDYAWHGRIRGRRASGTLRRTESYRGVASKQPASCSTATVSWKAVNQ